MRDLWSRPPGKIPRFNHRPRIPRVERHDRFARRRVLGESCMGIDTHPPETRPTMADPINLSDAERAKLEQRRDRLMKLLKDGDGEPLDAEDRADLTQEWHKIDQLLQRR
jgi:hypothetical protein